MSYNKVVIKSNSGANEYDRKIKDMGDQLVKFSHEQKKIFENCHEKLNIITL